MTYRDFLLPISSYPDTPAPGFVNAAFDLAKRFGADMTAMLLELDAHRSAWPSSFGTSLAGVSDLVGEASAQSRLNSRATTDQVKAEAARTRVNVNIVSEPTSIFPSSDGIIERAKLHDLVILSEASGFDRRFNESVIFGSGSPALLLPNEPAPVGLDTVAVAWDFTLTASRALRASLPLLSKAGRIHIFTIANEKESTAGRSINDLERHLSLHDLAFDYHEVDIAGRSIGKAFHEHTKNVRADVLVMGAFGHSRLREFVLGGATQSMFANPTLPVLFVH
jgi:nucleotide-binding universal stress UspA family protein